jgi:hypothetical protein
MLTHPSHRPTEVSAQPCHRDGARGYDTDRPGMRTRAVHGRPLRLSSILTHSPVGRVRVWPRGPGPSPSPPVHVMARRHSRNGVASPVRVRLSPSHPRPMTGMTHVRPSMTRIRSESCPPVLLAPAPASSADRGRRSADPGPPPVSPHVLTVVA